MKMRIFGGLFVLTILVALFFASGGDTPNKNSSATQNQSVPQNSSDADFKGLKIN